MYEEAIKEIKARKPKMAICYDFDKTLSPDDMQTFTLIPSFGLDKKTFWEESNALAKDNLMDNNLAWMYQLLNYSRANRLPIKKEYFNKIGAVVPLYNGVTTWFERMNKYADSKGIELEHYIISSGLKEIIEGSKIASQFKRVYASSYLYTADGVAEWPAQAVNYTNKTQFIFRIAKGFYEEYDERVNNSMNDDALTIPYENIVYIVRPTFPVCAWSKARAAIRSAYMIRKRTIEIEYINYILTEESVFTHRLITGREVIFQGL